MKLHILLALVSLTILVASIPVGLVANTLPTSNITNDVRSRGVQVFVPGATMPASNSTSPSILKLQPRKKKGPGAIRREKVKWLCFEASLQEFLAARKLRQPQGVDWHADGCSNKPDHLIPWNFKSSCQRHDFCLQNLLVDQAMKYEVDKKLRSDLRNECNVAWKKKYGGKPLCRAVVWIWFYVEVRKNFWTHYIYGPPAD